MAEETRRILILEQIVRDGQRRFWDLEAKVLRLEGQLAIARSSPGGGGGGVSTAYYCKSPGFSAATGAWPSITPATGTADVYKDVGGTWTLHIASQTIRWWFKDAGAVNKLVPVLPSADGAAWDALADSCTAM